MNKIPPEELSKLGGLFLTPDEDAAPPKRKSHAQRPVQDGYYRNNNPHPRWREGKPEGRRDKGLDPKKLCTLFEIGGFVKSMLKEMNEQIAADLIAEESQPPATPQHSPN